MRNALGATPVNLLCFACGEFHEQQRINDLAEKPTCARCGSNLLGVLTWSAWGIREALQRKFAKQPLDEGQTKALARVKQTADLVAVYGRKAVIAQAVYGVGPQTAAKLLARMHEDDRAFYEDLFEAKLKYITNRQFWEDRPRNEPASVPWRE